MAQGLKIPVALSGDNVSVSPINNQVTQQVLLSLHLGYEVGRGELEPVAGL